MSEKQLTAWEKEQILLKERPLKPGEVFADEAEMQSDNATFAQRFDSRDFARSVTEKARKQPAPWIKWTVTGMPLLAAAALFAVLLLPAGLSQDPLGERVKGSAAAKLEVFRFAGAGQPVELADQTPARRGDVLQLGYQVAQAGYGVIVSLDGRGTLTFHLGTAKTAASLEPGRLVFLTNSYELDDAPAWEVFVLATSRMPFSLAGLAGKNLNTPEALVQALQGLGLQAEARLTLRKEP